MVMSNSTQIQQPTTTTTTKQIFILSGQSNMSGRGGVAHNHWDGIIPPDSQPDPSILRLNAKSQWEQAHEPLHSNIDSKKVCGVGPGMSFANNLRKKLDLGLIGLVPCAVGGTSIKKWGRGHQLFDEMIRRAKESLINGGEIKGLIWYQGESDTTNRQDADDYKQNMENLINDVRRDLGSPSLPIIQVAIASAEGKYMEKVRESQIGISLPNVVCVDAKGLDLNEDHLHLTTPAQVKLGRMLADSYIKHFAAPRPPPPRRNGLLERKGIQVLWGFILIALFGGFLVFF